MFAQAHMPAGDVGPETQPVPVRSGAIPAPSGLLVIDDCDSAGS